MPESVAIMDAVELLLMVDSATVTDDVDDSLGRYGS